MKKRIRNRDASELALLQAAATLFSTTDLNPAQKLAVNRIKAALANEFGKVAA
jgi:hypothetical protein